MRAPFALVALLLLAGCASPGAAPPSAQPAAFDRAEAPWVAQVSSGCGMCSGQGEFRAYAEHHSFFVFENGRLAFVEWNGNPQPGDVRIAPSITYDATELTSLVRASPRGQGGAWGVRVTTANATEPGAAQALAALWGPRGEDPLCLDAGVSYLLRHGNGTVEEQQYTCGPQSGAMRDFAERIDVLQRNATANGRTQGIPRD